MGDDPKEDKKAPEEEEADVNVVEEDEEDVEIAPPPPGAPKAQDDDDKKSEDDEKGDDEEEDDADKKEDDSAKSGDKPDGDDRDRETRREERKDPSGNRFIDKVKRNVDRPKLPIQEPKKYDPLDLNNEDKYIKEVKDENGETIRVVDKEALLKDREEYAKAEAIKATQTTAEQQAAQAEQEKFFTETEYESRVLAAEKEFEFLKDSDNETTQHYLQQFALATGYNAVPVTDDQGRPVLGPDGKPQVREYVTNPGISFEKYVRELKARDDAILERRLAERKENMEDMAAKQGITPDGGSPKKGPRVPSLDEIADMDDEEYAKVRPLLAEKYGEKNPRR